MPAMYETCSGNAIAKVMMLIVRGLLIQWPEKGIKNIKTSNVHHTYDFDAGSRTRVELCWTQIVYLISVLTTCLTPNGHSIMQDNYTWYANNNNLNNNKIEQLYKH